MTATIHICEVEKGDSLSVLADPPSTVRCRLEHTNLLEGLNDVPLNTGSGIAVVAWAGTAAVLGTVKLGESADTDVLAEVDVTGNGGCDGAKVDISKDFIGPPYGTIGDCSGSRSRSRSKLTFSNLHPGFGNIR